jgi:hypothetical protein
MNADLARVAELFNRSCGDLPHEIVAVNGKLSQAAP